MKKKTNKLGRRGGENTELVGVRAEGTLRTWNETRTRVVTLRHTASRWAKRDQHQGGTVPLDNDDDGLGPQHFA